MITKEVTVVLTEDEINSDEPVEIKLHVHSEDNEEGISYTITYPKQTEK